MALTCIGVLESLFPFTMRVGLMHEKLWVVSWFLSTGNDRYSGHGYSGIDRFSGTKPPDDAILFTVSGITALTDKNLEILIYKRPFLNAI